ncbi:hypothetical protein J7T55_000021 [Diaporthe amygdali]|uniref:uncharacterized protein n=1 Tax=Phomopsis amygdali TaxID=1214568 RepID=UPI0022FDFA19|nr:uncharacterized protein J7T55_000021 [Diaporthe amygdali]KAJ0107759.1 hypothetical protein J7T55_000021 [Diaporthe amygdali]
MTNLVKPPRFAYATSTSSAQTSQTLWETATSRVDQRDGLASTLYCGTNGCQYEKYCSSIWKYHHGLRMFVYWEGLFMRFGLQLLQLPQFDSTSSLLVWLREQWKFDSARILDMQD